MGDVMAGTYRFSFGPWNIHEGADPFGPPVRESIAFAAKLREYRALGFEGVQFHDDDAVPDMNDMSAAEIAAVAGELKRMLDGEGLAAEFVAPGSGRTRARSTADTRPTTRTRAPTHASAAAGRSTSPTRWVPS